MASANLECVKRFVLGPGEHPDELSVAREDTVEKRIEAAAAEGGSSAGADARIQAVLDCLDPEIVIHIPPSMPYGGDHVGHEGFLRMSEAMMATWSEAGGSLEMSFVDIGNDEVMCFVSSLTRSRHTGRRVPMRISERYRLRGGKIYEIDLFYWDTAAIVEATGGVKTIVPR
jgi:ketosteroid isomerase-like protein